MSTILKHGGYSLSTYFDIGETKYSAGHNSYVEFLEVKNPPKGRLPYVVILYNYDNFLFCESSDKTKAEKAWDVIANGLVQDVSATWRSMGISRIYETKSLMILPWCYASNPLEIFGRCYASMEILQESKDGISKGDYYFVVDDAPNGIGKTFTLEKVAGILKESTVWESSRSTPFSLKDYRAISCDAEIFSNSDLIKKWNALLSGNSTREVVIEFSLLRVTLWIEKMFENNEEEFDIEVSDDNPTFCFCVSIDIEGKHPHDQKRLALVFYIKDKLHLSSPELFLGENTGKTLANVIAFIIKNAP